MHNYIPSTYGKWILETELCSAYSAWPSLGTLQPFHSFPATKLLNVTDELKTSVPNTFTSLCKLNYRSSSHSSQVFVTECSLEAQPSQKRSRLAGGAFPSAVCCCKVPPPDILATLQSLTHGFSNLHPGHMAPCTAGHTPPSPPHPAALRLAEDGRKLKGVTWFM